MNVSSHRIKYNINFIHHNFQVRILEEMTYFEIFFDI